MMALVLKADTSTITVPKVIETKNGMIFNGHYYNKDNLAPVAFEYLILDKNCVRNTLNTNKRLRPTALSSCSEVWNEDTIIADKYEPNIFYSIIYNKSDFNIVKYKEAQNKIELITSINIDSGYDKYLGQDKRYLYYSFRGSEAMSGSTNYIFNGKTIRGFNKVSAFIQIGKIDKQDLSNTQLNKCYYFYRDGFLSIPTVIEIYEDSNYIYYGSFTSIVTNYLGDRTRIPLKLVIYRIVKSNSFIEEIKSDIQISTDEIYNFIDNKDVFKISDNAIGFYLLNLSSEANEINPFKLIKVNFDEMVVDNMITVEEVTFTWNDQIKQSLSVFPDGVLYSYETFITKVNNKSYISIIMYQNADQYVTEQIVNQGIYTFEIIDFNNLKLTNYNRISDSVLKCYLLSKDRSFLIVSSANNTIFMKFDTEKGCFKITSTIEELPLSIGLDLSERVWIMKADNEVDVYSMSNPTDFNMKFEKDYYDYVGTNIETFITIEAKNFLGEYININVELTIDGNAKFKDNSSSVIKITTPSDGELNIPVIITGSNQITVCPKILSEGESS